MCFIIEPRGAPFVADGRRVGICQRYRGVDYYYTLFDTRYRIPVYSAYIPAPVPADGARSGRRRTGRWYVEHSLAPSGNGTQGMDQWPGSRGRVPPSLRDQLPLLQAVDDDYAESGFNRGHLNPNFLQDGQEARLATFTLTNAVPQEPCFNQGAWKRAEQLFDEVFVSFCYARGGQLHALTGAVPNYPAQAGDMRTTRTISCGDNDGGCSVWRPEDPHSKYHRVNIPSRMWSAACCRYGPANRPLALPYMHWGLNAGDGRVRVSVGGHELRHMELELRRWYYSERGGPVELFEDGCWTPASAADPADETLIRERLTEEAGDDPAVLVDGDLTEAPDSRPGTLLTIQLRQELYPMLLHARDRDEHIDRLTSRIYGLLATGRYFVQCVDPLDKYVHSHEQGARHARRALATPYCMLSMSYEADDPIPDLSTLRPPFPVPSSAAGRAAVSCGPPRQLGANGMVTAADVVTGSAAANQPCEMRLSAAQLTFVDGVLHVPRLSAGQYVDVYDGLRWLLRLNDTQPRRFLSSQHELVLRVPSPRVAWQLRYAAHSTELSSGDTVLLIDQETCAALSYPHRRRGWPHVRFMESPGGAGRHQVLLDGAAAGGTVGVGARVRLRTAHTTDPGYEMLYSSYTSNIYYDRRDDSSKQLWRVGGLPRHGGHLTLENVRYGDWFLGMKDRDMEDGGVFKGKLCRNPNRWLVYKLPERPDATPVQTGDQIAGFEVMVRDACTPGENKPFCIQT
ncbi:Endonuclease domain-containing 1 protein [Amphibalanus amphitrite]|uniref:Endonuclease domain-containing 1 protein n=1 Tax=Amphibalanus amphitrite TaxID=1232801 RepID=A0A6A4WUS9_AMPAM|nr:Endonuclease domain-containing 1 protein [Amphibalanus amphitrite]